MNKIPSSQHPISESDIDSSAWTVMQKLHESGFRALLVGGCVRDLFLRRQPKDFDVATNATPEQVADIFRNCRIVGRRFRLAHVHFGRKIIEVATFRASPADQMSVDGSGRLLHDNDFGSIEEDAIRRDFTVNALYYDFADQSVLDMTNGLQDIENKSLRLIGDAYVRYREDPVRMLRAARFAAKLGFTISEESAAPIHELAFLLADIPSARLFDESVKLFSEGASLAVFDHLSLYGLFAQLFPQTQDAIDNCEWVKPLIIAALKSTDARVKVGKPITPAFIYAVFLWWPVYKRLNLPKSGKLPPPVKIYTATQAVIGEQVKVTAIPRRFTTPLQEAYALQSNLEFYSGKKALRLLEKKRFRMAYDFLGLRAVVGNADKECFDWWTQIQEVSEEQQLEMASALAQKMGGVPRKRRRRKKSK